MSNLPDPICSQMVERTARKRWKPPRKKPEKRNNEVHAD